MQFGKENYLSVSYELCKGLNFKWNFKDLFQYTNYFHHIFVITETISDDLHQFLEMYYKKMKSGDLFSAIYYDKKKDEVKKMKWIERSTINSFDFRHLIKKMSSKPLPKRVKDEILELAVKETQGDNQHFVVNFILENDPSDTEDSLKKIVEEGRIKGGYTHICSFFGKFKASNVNFCDGINYFVFDKKQFQTVLHFYYIHVNNAAIKKAKMTLECTNGQLLCFHSKVWNTLDFNKLEKTFYGPSVSYTSDQIHFHMTEAMLGFEFQLILNLELTTFSHQQLRNRKKIILCVPSMKYLDKSINMAIYDSFVYSQGLALSCNPYSSFSIAKMIKN